MCSSTSCCMYPVWNRTVVYITIWNKIDFWTNTLQAHWFKSSHWWLKSCFNHFQWTGQNCTNCSTNSENKNQNQVIPITFKTEKEYNKKFVTCKASSNGLCCCPLNWASIPMLYKIYSPLHYFARNSQTKTLLLMKIRITLTENRNKYLLKPDNTVFFLQKQGWSWQ